MAKKRSNDSFAPIVITILVAGVVGYYLIKDTPQSTQADSDLQSESAPGGLLGEGVPQPSAKPQFTLERPKGFTTGPAFEARGSGLDTKRDPSRNPLERSGKSVQRSVLEEPSAIAASRPAEGLDPTPAAPEKESPSTASTSPVGAVSKNPDAPNSSGEQTKPEPVEATKPKPQPAVAPVEKPKPAASTEIYTVQDGDVIITIAEDWFGESGRHDEIIALNPGVDPTKLQIGQILKMPRKSQPRTKPVDPTLAANEYRIAPNDNYTRIARLLLGDEARASEIAALNPDLDPGNLQVGTIIKLPPKRVRKPAAQPVKRPPLRTGEKYYTVKSGDSLARIVGDLWGVQREDWVELLYQRNKDTIGEDPTKLNLEQILVIPVKPKS